MCIQKKIGQTPKKNGKKSTILYFNQISFSFIKETVQTINLFCCGKYIKPILFIVYMEYSNSVIFLQST